MNETTIDKLLDGRMALEQPKKGYRIAVEKSRCHGIDQGEEQRVRAYLDCHGTKPSVLAEKAYTELTRDPRIADLDVDNPSIFKMIFMATYNLDAFREFIFESTFLQRFSLPVERVERLKTDNAELLAFGLEWLDFGLFGRMNFQVSEQAAQAVEAKVAEGKIPGLKPVEKGAEKTGEEN